MNKNMPEEMLSIHLIGGEKKTRETLWKIIHQRKAWRSILETDTHSRIRHVRGCVCSRVHSKSTICLVAGKISME